MSKTYPPPKKEIFTRFLFVKTLIILAVFYFGLTELTPKANAFKTHQIEAIATVEVVHGFLNKYNVGLSFTNASDCKAKIGELNLLLQNLHAQGLQKVINQSHFPAKKQDR